MKGLFALALLAAAYAQSCKKPLMFGETITIVNMYDSRYFLDRNGPPVLTTSTGRISLGSAKWKVLTTSYSAPNRPVTSSDYVILQNQYSGLYLLERDGGVEFSMNDQSTRISNYAAVFRLKGTDGGSEITYGEDMIIENQHPGKYMLQKSGGPAWTTDYGRVTNKAAVWQARNTNLNTPYVACPTDAPTAFPTTDAPTAAPTYANVAAALSADDLSAGLGFVFGYTGDVVYLCDATMICKKNSPGARNQWDIISNTDEELAAATVEASAVNTTDGTWTVQADGIRFATTIDPQSDKELFFPVTCACVGGGSP